MLKTPDIITNAMKRLRGSVGRSPCRNIRGELDELCKKISSEISPITQTLCDYKSLVDEYYSSCPPFGSGDKQEDFDDFIEIIAHSLVINNYLLLDRWAIEYPKNNPQRLAEPLSWYPRQIAGVVNNDWQTLSEQCEWPPQAKDFCLYIVEKLTD